MAEPVLFYFDPICPWTYLSSRWARALERMGEIELSWGLFSLETQNAGQEPENLAASQARSALALRTAIFARDAGGPRALGAFYAALGQRVHERDEALDATETVEAALDDAGLEPALCEKAWADDSTTERMADEHRALRDRTRSFGVPTIVLDGGEGPAIFGPVVSEMPTDEDAVALWRHVSWLARYENFSELKRDRISSAALAARPAE